MPPPLLPPLENVDPAEAWQPWQPDGERPWNLKWAGHLYRRAGFGANLTQLRDAVRQGHAATLDRLLHGGPEAASWEDFLTSLEGQMARRSEPNDLRGWWLYCLLYTSYPLREKMTLFWHNHFATSITKVAIASLMFNQQKTLRRHALGNFRTFLLAMSRDPAMLVWLDSNSNVKGKPNENYARELMELFSLGVGNYTETDIREAARAFTGWHSEDGEYTFIASQHDDGEKTARDKKGILNGD